MRFGNVLYGNYFRLITAFLVVVNFTVSAGKQLRAKIPKLRRGKQDRASALSAVDKGLIPASGNTTVYKNGIYSCLARRLTEGVAVEKIYTQCH